MACDRRLHLFILYAGDQKDSLYHADGLSCMIKAVKFFCYLMTIGYFSLSYHSFKAALGVPIRTILLRSFRASVYFLSLILISALFSK